MRAPLIEWGCLEKTPVMAPIKNGGWYEKFAVDQRIAALEQENAKLREALKSIAEGNNDICAYDPTLCPNCSCPSCQARNALLEAKQ